jgi:hypothetical protein
MTARELIDLLAQRPALLVGALVLLPLSVLLLGWIHGAGAGSRSPWRYVYAAIVYGASIPGVGAAVLTAYTLFFTRENLVDKNLLVYVLPVVSMALTLGLMRRQVAFDDVPGFDRLSGLMVLIAVTFGIVLAIKKTFVGIFFGASIGTLLVIAAGVFALLKWGAQALLRRPGEPRAKPPGFPSL